MTKYNAKSGVALYLAIVVGSILITTGMGFSGIFFRELRISRLQFPSLVSFYAADAGQECALYYDLEVRAFNDPSTAPATIECFGIDLPIDNQTSGGVERYKFFFNLSSEVSACADVTIKKEFIDIPSFGNTLCTRIDSYGENATCLSGEATVQRGYVTIDPESCIGLIDQ